MTESVMAFTSLEASGFDVAGVGTILPLRAPIGREFLIADRTGFGDQSVFVNLESMFVPPLVSADHGTEDFVLVVFVDQEGRPAVFAVLDVARRACA